MIALAALPGGAADAAPAPEGPSPEAVASATAGRDWLASRLKSELPLQVFGSASWGTTLDAASALAAVDATDPLIEAVWDAAVTNREAIVNDGTEDLPGRLAQMVLLAYTLDKDPRAVGAAPGSDLVARLAATMRPAGVPDAGMYGAQSPTYDGVYRQGLAFAALASAGVEPDPLAFDWLIDQQCIGAFEGSWMSYRSDTSVPCISDPVSWVGPDSNATAFALTGLVEAFSGDPVAEDAVVDVLTWLDSDQNADGGWGGYPWADTDPNSTAVVIQALIAAGSEGDAAFADQTGTPVAALLSFQLGAGAPAEDRGAFTYPGTANSPSEMATVQAVVAAAGYPVIFRPEPVDTTTTTTTVVSTTVDHPVAPAAPDAATGAVAPGAARPVRLAG